MGRFVIGDLAGKLGHDWIAERNLAAARYGTRSAGAGQISARKACAGYRINVKLSLEIFEIKREVQYVGIRRRGKGRRGTETEVNRPCGTRHTYQCSEKISAPSSALINLAQSINDFIFVLHDDLRLFGPRTQLISLSMAIHIELLTASVTVTEAEFNFYSGKFLRNLTYATELLISISGQICALIDNRQVIPMRDLRLCIGP